MVIMKAKSINDFKTRLVITQPFADILLRTGSYMKLQGTKEQKWNLRIENEFHL